MSRHEHDPAECRGLFERLSEYMDGELPESSCTRFEDHFRDCPRCVEFVKQMRRAVRLVESMPCPQLPDDLRRSLTEAAAALQDDGEAG